jgi:phytol kinase
LLPTFYYPSLFAPLPWPELTFELLGQVSLVAAWVLVLLLAAEAIHRWTPLDKEVSRKIVHLGTGNLIILAWWLNLPALLGVLAAVAFSALTLISYKYPVLASVSSIGRKSWGTFFYAVSIGLLMALFWAEGSYAYAAIGILIMTWGDGLAALIGQNWGKHRYQLWGINKSWEGSLTMALVSFGVCMGVLAYDSGYSGHLWAIAAIVGLGAAGLEAFSKYGIDNLTVPLSTALLSWGLVEGFAKYN